MEDGLILLFLESHRGWWEQCHSDLCGLGITDCRCDRTPRCHLHLLCHCMLLEVPFIRRKVLLTSGWEAVDLSASCWLSEHTRTVWGTGHNITQNDMTHYDATQPNTVRHNLAWNNGKTTQHKPTKKQATWNNVEVDKRSTNISKTHQACSHYWKWWKAQLVSKAVYLLFPHKVTFSGGSRADTHQCGIWGNWKQGHWVCSESPFVLLFTVAAATKATVKLSGCLFKTEPGVSKQHPVHSRST